MAFRTVCLCDGKYIGIETIFTVIDGKQINIPDKLSELRAKSRNNELFCPCGCGANLILVAGDKNLREQHFRVKDGFYESECHVVTEGKISVASKIVLKCWLDENLKTGDVEARVPIKLVGSTDRKYEFSFLSRSRRMAVSYCCERANLSDEKFEILRANSDDIRIIYIVDIMNGGVDGQYPEALMKIQKRQGYCLLLDVKDASYSEAMMCATFYAQNYKGLWQEVQLAHGCLGDYTISEAGEILYKQKSLLELLEEQRDAFLKLVQEEKERYEKRQKELQQAAEEAQKKQQREETEPQDDQEAKKRRYEEFKRNMDLLFSQQEIQIRDSAGNRWVQCEICGRRAKETEFMSYGGKNHVNLGICKSCSYKR